MIDLLLGAFLAFLATSLGAAGVFGLKKIPNKDYPLILSFCAGVMIFSAFEMMTESHALAGNNVAFIGLIIGLSALFVLEKILPHIHGAITKKEVNISKKKVNKIAGTITLHNIPEGFAIAAAFASSNPLGWLVATTIAVQDIPEGLVISAPLAYFGLDIKKSFLWGVFSGIVEFVAAVIAYFFLNSVSIAQPIGLAFSAGAMFYVAFFELFLEPYKKCKNNTTILVLILGITFAFLLASLLGLMR